MLILSPGPAYQCTLEKNRMCEDLNLWTNKHITLFFRHPPSCISTMWYLYLMVLLPSIHSNTHLLSLLPLQGPLCSRNCEEGKLLTIDCLWSGPVWHERSIVSRNYLLHDWSIQAVDVVHVRSGSITSCDGQSKADMKPPKAATPIHPILTIHFRILLYPYVESRTTPSKFRF